MFSCIINDQIYLNRYLIRRNDINLKNLQDDIASFKCNFCSGHHFFTFKP